MLKSSGWLPFLVFCFACGSHTSKSTSAAPKLAANAPRTQPPRPSPIQTAAANERTPSSGDPAKERGATTPMPQGFELTFADDFAHSSLPSEGPSLRAFALKSKIHVGQSHLTELAMLSQSLVAVLSDVEAKVRVYDLAKKKLLGIYEVPGMNADSTGQLLGLDAEEPHYIASSAGGIFLAEARSGEVVQAISRESWHEIRWSADRKLLIASSNAASTGPPRLGFFERTGSLSFREVGRLSFPERVDAFDLSRDRRLLAVVHYPSNLVRVLALDEARELFRLPAPLYGGDCAFSPDGRLLAISGNGILVVDLLNPSRRAFYSYLHNNSGRVRFSPAGDTLLASSYDGMIRAFDWGDPDAPDWQLKLLRELEHGGHANVYGFELDAHGQTLVSVSGSQFIHVFSAGEKGGHGKQAHRFRSLAEWHAHLPEAREPLKMAELGTISEQEGYLPPLMTAAPRPSSLREGSYECKVSSIYRLRDCTVARDPEGRTILTFHDGNLLSLRGVVYDDGPILRYQAGLLERDSVVSCPGCEEQPLEGIFRGQNGKYEGLLTFRTVYDPYRLPPQPPRDAKLEEAQDRFRLVLRYRGPLTSGSSSSGGPPARSR